MTLSDTPVETGAEMPLLLRAKPRPAAPAKRARGLGAVLIRRSIRRDDGEGAA